MAKRVLVSNVVEDRTLTFVNVWRIKPFFREQLRTSPVGGTPLVLEPVDSPVLSGSGMRACAGPPSSSSGVEGPQPKAHQPDPIVRRGLKRASEGDMEISENCSWISDVSVKEGPHPQVLVGEFADEEEWQALSAELARLDEFDAKKDITQDQATGPLLTFTWVRTVKCGAPNYRLCLRPSGRQ